MSQDSVEPNPNEKLERYEDKLESGSPKLLPRPRLKYLILGTIYGALPGVLLSLAGSSVGTALMLRGGMVGLLMTYERIGIGRLIGLVVFGVLVKISGPLANKIAEDSQDDARELETDDLFTLWLLSGSRKQSPLAIVIGILLGLSIPGLIVYLDVVSISNGGQALILPLWNSPAQDTGMLACRHRSENVAFAGGMFSGIKV